MREGSVKSFNHCQINSINEVTYLVKEKQQLHAASNLLDISATMLIKNSSYDALKKDLDYLATFEPIHYA